MSIQLKFENTTLVLRIEISPIRRFENQLIIMMVALMREGVVMKW